MAKDQRYIHRNFRIFMPLSLHSVIPVILLDRQSPVTSSCPYEVESHLLRKSYSFLFQEVYPTITSCSTSPDVLGSRGTWLMTDRRLESIRLRHGL